MRWCTAVGAWGDSFVAVGRMRALLSSLLSEPFGIVHYGFDPHISAFLALQKGVAEVKHVRPDNMAAYRYWLPQMSEPTVPLCEYAGELLRGTGIAVSDVLRTQVYNLHVRQPVHRWHDPILPIRAEAWARTFIERTCGEKPYVMLHPYSTQSSPLDGHWPWWKQAIEWLAEVAEEQDFRIIWTGAESPIEVKSRAIVNAIGLTPSMMEVYALQRQSRLTIATSNGCAHWAVMDQTPAVICCNNHMLPTDRHIFKEWISCPPVSQVEYTDNLSAFQKAVTCALLD